jgi:hypothetical protein
MSLGPTVDIEVVNATVEIASTGATVTVDVPETTVDITGVGPQGPAGTGAEGYYGQFYDTTDQIAASTTVAYPVKFNTTESSNGVSVANNGSGDPTRITFAHNAVYNVQFSLQFKNTASQDALVNIWFRLDGVDIADSNSQYTIPQKHGSDDGALIAALNLLVEPADNQYVELIWQTENTAISLQTLPAGTTPTAPVTPSAILTATQVMNLQAGPQGPAGQGVPTGGSTGTVLVKNSATNYDTAWSTYKPGMYFIKEVAIGSGVASVSVTSCFNASFDNYRVMIANPIGSVSFQTQVNIQFTNATSSYYGGFTWTVNGGSILNVAVTNASTAPLFQAFNGAGTIANFDIASPFAETATAWSGTHSDGARWSFGGGQTLTSVSSSGFTLTTSSGNLTGGTIRVYGYNQ